MTKRASDVCRPSPPRRRSKYTLAPLVLIAANVVLFDLFFVAGGDRACLLVHELHGRGGVPVDRTGRLPNLFGDSTFYDAVSRTLLYTVLFVPLNFVVSLLAPTCW